MQFLNSLNSNNNFFISFDGNFEKTNYEAINLFKDKHIKNYYSNSNFSLCLLQKIKINTVCINDKIKTLPIYTYIFELPSKARLFPFSFSVSDITASDSNNYFFFDWFDFFNTNHLPVSFGDLCKFFWLDLLAIPPYYVSFDFFNTSYIENTRIANFDRFNTNKYLIPNFWNSFFFSYSKDFLRYNKFNRISLEQKNFK